MSLPNRCPSCLARLIVTGLECEGCGIALQGEFPLPVLLQLDAEDLGFVLSFVRASGSLKQVAKECGSSYPTVRNRLNRIIETLSPPVDHEVERLKILDKIANGEIDVATAAALLKGLSNG